MESSPPSPAAPGTAPSEAPPKGGGGVGTSLVLLNEWAERARQKGWPFADLDDAHYEIPREVLDLMESRPARDMNVIPWGIKKESVLVACENPDDLSLRSRLSPLFGGRTIRFVAADPAAIRRQIETNYSAASEANRLASERSSRFSQASEGGDLGRIESGAEGGNVALLNLMIEQALRDGASDIHIEPSADSLEVRYRVDGKLRQAGSYPRDRAKELVNLIKVQGGMRTDNSLTPDSGVIVYDQPGRQNIDIRVETAPTAWGMSAVMRLQSNIWRPLDSLGFSDYNIARFRQAIDQPFGIILATGPTGSGKSTTLYASLNEKISPELKILTLENPIEYKAPSGISQIQINDSQGMTFASGLRSILRKDPDVILVGEIRDTETAETAVDAAMTGHLLFSTLHTNSAPGAIARLTRMDIEPLLVADALQCVLGQRLVRRLCESCKVVVAPDRDLIASWGFDVDRLEESVFAPSPEGCNDCLHRGFSGRVPIHEVMLVSPEMQEAIADAAPQSVLDRLAREAGMTSMREDGYEKAILEGITTVAEVKASTLSTFTAAAPQTAAA